MDKHGGLLYSVHTCSCGHNEAPVTHRFFETRSVPVAKLSGSKDLGEARRTRGGLFLLSDDDRQLPVVRFGLREPGRHAAVGKLGFQVVDECFEERGP